MRKLILTLTILVLGCGYSANDVADFPVRCESCASGGLFGGAKTTTIHCRADSVLATCCHTKCRHCGKMLAEWGDDVGMTSLSGGVYVIKRGR